MQSIFVEQRKFYRYGTTRPSQESNEQGATAPYDGSTRVRCQIPSHNAAVLDGKPQYQSPSSFLIQSGISLVPYFRDCRESALGGALILAAKLVLTSSIE